MTDSALFLAVADAAVRGTLVLLAALAATGLMRRSSAAARHLVWLAALAALLLLPLARSFVPEWRVLPLPPVPVASAPDVAAASSPIDRSSGSAVLPVSAPPATAPAAAAVAAEGWWASVDWVRLALMVWAAGVLLFGVRLAYGVARIRWIERRATELTDDEWVTLTDGLARRLRLGRIVRLLREPAATVPMTWGVFHPIVLLPAESDQWEAERRRVVLAHELAHVGRWDAATQWIAHVALVVFWFNPLVWVAARRLREEREHACDDAVLAIGTRAADYADHLLDIVRKLGSSSGPGPALAMARRSQFEGRLLAILDNAVRRNGVSRTAGLATAAAALVCLLPLAALRPAPAGETLVATVALPSDPPLASTPGIETPGVATALRPTASEPSTTAPRVIGSAERRSTAAARQAPPPTTPVVKAGGSDADAAAVLREAIGRGDPGLYAEIIRAAEDIKSASARRMVLTGLLEKSDLSAANIAAIVAATRTMDSDLEKRIVLTSVVEHRAFRASPSLPPAMAPALASFSSALEQRIVMTGIWHARRWDAPSLAALFRVVASVDSDLERRIILTGAAARQTVQGSAREAYLAAARAIGSEMERGLALNALASSSSTRSTPPRTETAERAPTTSRNARTETRRTGEAQWDSDFEIEGLRNGKPCYVELHASKVIFGTARSDIRRILPGGRLHLERRYDGHVHIVRGVPGEGGRPVFTYTVDGQRRPFEDEGRAWMNAFIQEYTGA